MDEKTLVQAIKNLALRLECGNSTIGDFLRAKVGLPENPECLTGARMFDWDMFEAMAALSKSALRGYKFGDNTYGMIREQLRDIYRGLMHGMVDEQFFVRI
jgi:hypothetical protein